VQPATRGESGSRQGPQAWYNKRGQLLLGPIQWCHHVTPPPADCSLHCSTAAAPCPAAATPFAAAAAAAARNPAPAHTPSGGTSPLLYAQHCIQGVVWWVEKGAHSPRLLSRTMLWTSSCCLTASLITNRTWGAATHPNSRHTRGQAQPASQQGQHNPVWDVLAGC
jgi:hypothetical protein